MNRINSLLAIVILIAGLSINSTPSAVQSASNSESMQPWLSCQFEDGLEIVQRDRLPKDAVKFRMVNTHGGSKRVSRIDGYRVMFRYPKTDYFFANVKVEQSDPEAYAQDKLTIIEEINHVATAEKGEPLTKTYNGLESYGAAKPTIDKGGTIAMQVLFSDEDKLIITVYFLNQGRKNRRFKTLDEFNRLKEAFLDRYTSCVKAKVKERVTKEPPNITGAVGGPE